MAFQLSRQEDESAFGQLLIEQLQPQLQVTFPNGLINLHHYNCSVSSSFSSITWADSMIRVGTGDEPGEDKLAVFETRDRCRYNPGHGIRNQFTAVFSSDVPTTAGDYQIIGCGTDLDGFFFGRFYDTDEGAASFGVLKRNNGVASWTRQDSWSEETLLGPSAAFAFDPTKGNIYTIQYQWLGFGPQIYSLEYPDRNKLCRVHFASYANEHATTSIRNANLPFRIECRSQDTSNLWIRTPSVAMCSEGDYRGMRGFQARSLVQVLSEIKSNSITHCLTIRNKASVTVDGVTLRNDTRMRLTGLSLDNPKTGGVKVKVFKDADPGTDAGAFRDYDPTSVVEIATVLASVANNVARWGTYQAAVVGDGDSLSLVLDNLQLKKVTTTGDELMASKYIIDFASQRRRAAVARDVTLNDVSFTVSNPFYASLPTNGDTVTVSNGRLVWSGGVPDKSFINVDVGDGIEIVLNPGETLVFTAQPEANLSSLSLGVTWNEEF